jgi:hypothetical protein
VYELANAVKDQVLASDAHVEAGSAAAGTASTPQP